MKTVILMWNPAISSFRMNDYLDGLGDLVHFSLNWSVWEHEDVHEDDRFLMVRVGEGQTGVVMSGTIISEPYKGEDWSGKGRITYYVDLDIEVMLHPDKAPLLTTKQLQEILPDFDWTGGHSGRVMSEKDGTLVCQHWQLHLEEIQDIFEDEELGQRAPFIQPKEMLLCVEKLLKGQHYVIHRNDELEFNYLADSHYCISVDSPSGETLFIDFEEQFTLSFCECEIEYFDDTDSFEELKSDILDIFANRLGTVIFEVEDEWFGDAVTSHPITDREDALEKVRQVYTGLPNYMKEIRKKGVRVNSFFWDSTKNSSVVLDADDFKKN